MEGLAHHRRGLVEVLLTGEDQGPPNNFGLDGTDE